MFIVGKLCLGGTGERVHTLHTDLYSGFSKTEGGDRKGNLMTERIL